MNFTSFATTHQYVQGVEPEIIKSISSIFEKETIEAFELKIAFPKELPSPTTQNEQTKPIELEGPKLVIDDVIVMLNDVPIEIELLSFHSAVMPSTKHSFSPNQSPG